MLPYSTYGPTPTKWEREVGSVYKVFNLLITEASHDIPAYILLASGIYIHSGLSLPRTNSTVWHRPQVIEAS